MQNDAETIRIRGELETTALLLYHRYSKEYREIIPQYESLLDEKRRLKLSPLKAIKKTDLNEFPSIRLLAIPEVEDALNYITEEETLALIRELNSIYRYVDSWILRLLRSTIAEYQYAISHHGKNTSSYLYVGHNYPNIGF